MSHPHGQDGSAEVVVFYPACSLRVQLAEWNRRHPQHRFETSRTKSLPGLRRSLRRATLAMVDATDDPKQASEAFLEAVARLGAYGVAVYSERTHQRLESFVRMHGALWLLGPMGAEQWDGFFEGMLRSLEARRLRGAGEAAPKKEPARAGEPGLREPTSGPWTPVAARRPATGVN